MKRNGNSGAKVLLGLIAAAVAVWIILTSLGAAGTREWQSYTASLRARGQPLTFAEIEARRVVIPEDQNSARVIEGLAGALAERRGGAVTLDSISGSREAGDFFDGLKRGRIEPARELLSKHEDILTKLADLREKRSGRFAIDFGQTNPLQISLAHCSHVRAASKLVRAHSTIRLIDADQAGALGDFELQCRLAGSLSDEPMLISRLVQIAIQAQAIATAEDMLRVGTTDDESLQRMGIELGAMKQGGTLKWGLLGERAHFSEACEALFAGRIPLVDCQTRSTVEESAVLQFIQHVFRFPAFLMRSNQLRGAQMLTSLIDAADDPRALLAAAEKSERDVENLPQTQMMVKIYMPSLTRAVILNTRISAHLDCAVAALAAERFRLAEGRLPDTLDALVPAYLPAVPIDPFDGKPLRMAKADDGLLIYSVDDNGVDDGADFVLRKEEARKRALDLGFRLNDITHRGVLIIDDPPREED